ncbi:MAG TPA: DUF2177 family protein [Caulobacter sp.]|nr:DUF2177 family protein [Caulobacter sp.]
MTWIAAYVAAAVSFLGLDALWLGLIARTLYQREFGALLLEKPNMAAAAAFYALYLGGVVFFAVKPALDGGGWTRALLNGALFGLVAYATYDLTNLATLKGFPIRVVAPDLAWGAAVTAIAALAGYAAAARVS